MEMASAIVGILAAGAAAASKEVAGQAVKDLYVGLKAALSKLLTKSDKLDDLEVDPGSQAAKDAVEADLKASIGADADTVAALAAKLAQALSDLDAQSLERAGIEIGNITAAQNTIIRDLRAEGGVTIRAVTARDGNVEITGIAAGAGREKK